MMLTDGHKKAEMNSAFLLEIWWKQQEENDFNKLGDNIAIDSKLQR